MRAIPYGRQYIDKTDIAEVIKVLRTNWITQGPKVGEFEDALKRYCGAKYAVAVSSGTAALHIACLAAGLNKDDEAITTPITFAATANSILYSGAKPVFADIDPQTANIDARKIIEKITKRTKAILPVHFAGLPCDMGRICGIAKKGKFVIIEDACHALGAQYKYKGKWFKVGNCRHSDMTVFSFHPVKTITTGEGGAVLTNSKALYNKLLLLRNHGITKDSDKFVNKRFSDLAWYHEMQCLGFNYRITDIQCALGIGQLKKIGIFLKRRKEIAKIYSKKLAGFNEIILPIEKPYAKSSWHLYYIRIKKASRRKAVFEKLRKAGIGVQVHYIPVYLHPFYQKMGYGKSLCQNAEDFYQQEISIPIYPTMKNHEIEYVVKSIGGALR